VSARELARPASRGPRLFGGLRGSGSRARDVTAGLTLAAMNVPQALGYARIAGMPLVTGLYTLLAPLLAFAAFGSSRYLVVAADSATAAILAGGLTSLAPAAGERYVALAALVALLTAAGLFLARILKLGFLADFLSQTVLVGFLTGVGVQVGIAVLGEMLGLEMSSRRTLGQLFEAAAGLPRAHLPTIALSASVVAGVLLLRRFVPRVPGPLVAVAGAIAASAAFGFAGRGIAVIGPIAGGLPRLGLPKLTAAEALAVLPLAGSCFLVIVAQSAATARAYASRHRDVLDENADLVGLAAANASAALTGAFVVNGSPTQTAMVERSGGRSQLAHLVTAGVVAVVLVSLTGPLQYLPRCVLGAIVFTIAIGLVDVAGLADILKESPGEFRLAMVTAAVVVGIGIEQGILLAMVLSLLRHVRHSYRPHTAVLIQDPAGVWRSLPASPGTVSRPGVVVFRFGADLFYANAERFSRDARGLVAGAPKPLSFLVVDAGAITSIDYSAARMMRQLIGDLAAGGVTLVLAHVSPSLQADLVRHRLMEAIGSEHLFDTLRSALSAMDAGGRR
jgi:SulP family sulfate permease